MQIICPSHWGSGIDIYGSWNEDHSLLFEFLKLGVIVIDECEYEIQNLPADDVNARSIELMLGKRNSHPVLREMAALLGDEPFEMSEYYRNTIYLPNQKAFVRADGMKPEDIAEMLSHDGCDKIILFPYFPLDEKSAYYKLTLNIEKDKFVDIMRRVEERRLDKMNEAIRQANERSKAGYRATLRLEKKSDRKIVEQITYRAFRDTPSTGTDDDGTEALFAHKLRSRTEFVPELDYVAELNGTIIGNIMYTRSKIVNNDGGEWDTLTFGPVSVLPKYQRDGVGSVLINKTLEVARRLGHRAVLIFGHESYYPRFGFKPASEFGITTAEGKNFPAFMALPLYDGALEGVYGRLICVEGSLALDKEESEKLNAKLAEPMNADEYIDVQPLYYQQFLRRVRGAIRTASPDSDERIAYNMPCYYHGKTFLIGFAAFKKHIGVYPGAEAMTHFASQLWRYKTSKGAIQFPFQTFGDEQVALISEIAAWCGREKNDYIR